MWQSVITVACAGERSRLVVLSARGARMAGLLGKARLRRDVGVLILRCNAVHTIGMRFSIDVVFLDRTFNVLRVVPGLRPGRFAYCCGASIAVEWVVRPGESLAGLTRRARKMAHAVQKVMDAG